MSFSTMPASITLQDLDPRQDGYATQVVDRLLQAAVQAGASDIHLDATPDGVTVKWRVGGSLLPVTVCPDGETTRIIARIKALARLITYRYDIPQEGRMVLGSQALEARVGILPTLHGERAVIRIVAKQTHAWLPEQLGLPPDTLQTLQCGLQRDSGVLLISGIAGSGKTTTAYACLREVLKDAKLARSVVSLEDPIETEIAGASQSQINPAVGYDWSSGLKALLRQDPEVLLVGEIREPETAAVVFQAAMTGQLVLTTMHARSAADTLRRLLDMHVPPYHLRNALNVLICQRLIRRACGSCQGSGRSASDAACDGCGGGGWAGRILLAEHLPPIEGELARTLMHDAETRAISQVAQRLGMQSLAKLAADATAKGTICVGDAERYFIEESI